MRRHALLGAANHLDRDVDAVHVETHGKEVRQHDRGTAADLEQPTALPAQELHDDALLRDEGELLFALPHVLERERVEERLDLRLGLRRRRELGFLHALSLVRHASACNRPPRRMRAAGIVRPAQLRPCA